MCFCVYVRFSVSSLDYAILNEKWDRMNVKSINLSSFMFLYRPCGVTVRVPGYRSRGPRFDYRRYQIFWKVVGLERGPLSLMSTIEELLGRKSGGFSLDNREYDRVGPSALTTRHIYPQKLVLTSPTSGGCSVGIARTWTNAMEFF
jgi:hypothetical protein